MAYLVALALDFIDLSFLSKKNLVDDLLRLASRQTAAAPVATAAAASAAAATALA